MEMVVIDSLRISALSGIIIKICNLSILWILVTRALVPFEAWKYFLTADFTKALKIYGKHRKFCPTFKCHATGQEGIFQFSHWAKAHVDGYWKKSAANTTQKSTVTEYSVKPAPAANFSRFVSDPYSIVPTRPLELTVLEAYVTREFSPDEMSFLGAWCVQ